MSLNTIPGSRKSGTSLIEVLDLRDLHAHLRLRLAGGFRFALDRGREAVPLRAVALVAAASHPRPA